MGYAKARSAVMERKAKIFMNNRSQAVRLPKDYQFKTRDVFIRKEGDEVILSPRPKTWADYFKNSRVASPDFMEDYEDLPVQARKL
jgi:antitoxin VapB